MRNSPLGRILAFIAGILMIIAAICGIYNGHISVGRHIHHTVYRAADPHWFWANVIFYAVIGVIAICISLRNP
jgi:hypothetical protein